MRNLSTEYFSDLVYEKLEKLYKNKPILSNPDTESKFPILELHTPLKSVNKTENAFPILSTFQISVTCWNKKQRQAMQMTSEVETILQQINFLRTNTSPAIYDPILQKYGITITFEVRYNAIMDSFEFIR